MTSPTIAWQEQPHFAGLDWARSHHDVIVLNRHGSVQENLHFEHTAEGWRKMHELVARYPRLPVAVETSQGTVVEQLLACGARVYPVNPKAAKRYRERHAPSGVKDDERDAWSLGDALRLDGAEWRELAAQDPIVAELRLLCADEVALIEERTALINRLRQCLHEYYPAALEAFEDWTCRGTWAFVVAFPTPAALAAAGKRKWQNFLHAHSLWRQATAPERLAIFARAEAFCGSKPTIAAKSLLAVSLARLLQTIEAQLDVYRARIAATFAQHPDHDLFGSLPGTGEKLAPRLLAHLGSNRAEFASAEALQCFSGTAPLTIKSGQICHQRVRHACNDPLRATLHLWADHSRTTCAWAATYYQKHRDDGQSHACALRCLAQRWLKILWKMWQTRTLYDEALHTRNQTKHGSWILSLKPA
jgi:transposase